MARVVLAITLGIWAGSILMVLAQIPSINEGNQVHQNNAGLGLNPNFQQQQNANMPKNKALPVSNQPVDPIVNNQKLQADFNSNSGAAGAGGNVPAPVGAAGRLRQPVEMNRNNPSDGLGNEDVEELRHEKAAKKHKELRGRPGAKIPAGLDREEMAQHQINPESPPDEPISQRAECAHDIKKYCGNVNQNSDVEVIVCLQEHTLETDFLASDCQNLIWFYKFQMSQDHRFTEATKQFCPTEINKFEDCAHPAIEGPAGFLVSCMIDHLPEIDMQSTCGNFLRRMEYIMFSDWRLIGPFAATCKDDIHRAQCGRTDTNDIHHHTQGEVVECLLQKLVESDKHKNKKQQGNQVPTQAGFQMNEDCRHQVLRIAELQSDDYHLDRPLYYACRADRDMVCSHVEAGGGKVLACLIQQRLLNKVSQMCAEKLLLREQLMARNYKQANPLIKSCVKEISSYKCAPPPPMGPNGRPLPQVQNPIYFSLTYILLCLENAAHDHEVQWQTEIEKLARKEGEEVAKQQKIPPALTGACADQVVEHRRMLMSDYRIAPEIVLHCSDEITQYCEGNVQRDGETLHCLMRTMENMEMKEEHGFGGQCINALRDMVKMADVDSNYHVDMVLERDCKRAIDTVCSSYHNSEVDMLTCLMDHIESEDVSNECEARLVEIQYFMARDFTLDHKLFEACAEDAVAMCKAKPQWFQGGPMDGVSQPPGPDTSGLVLPCLYRHAFEMDPEDNAILHPKCSVEVKRVMHERAISVKLMPQVEDRCIHELGTICSEKIEPGQELQCLQDHYEDEGFSAECRDAVREFTQMESKDIKLNRLLTHACAPAIDAFCPALKESEVDGIDVMQCLLDHKNEQQMTPKCAAYVHHYELVSMKDYRFSAKFVTQCKGAIQHYCPQVETPISAKHANGLHSKAEIIRCLSQTMFEQHVLGEGGENVQDPLTPGCRKQLQLEYLMVQADPEVDPALKMNCENDMNSFCNTEEGKLKPMECLRARKSDLSSTCRQFIFQKEEVEFNDNRFDYTLMKSCRAVIQAKCSEETKDNILSCLKKNRNDESMTDACRSVVRRRMKEQVSDIRLQPHLRKACKGEISKFCKTEMDEFRNMVKKHNDDTDSTTNVVVTCLRREYSRTHDALNPECQETVKKLIMESELDPEMDPPFYAACKDELKALCTDSVLLGRGHHSLVECLKAQYFSGTVRTPKCLVELERRTNEELMDIDIDVELHDACQQDIKRYCGDVRHGNGQIVKCLVSSSQSSNVQLTDSCRSRLEDRKKLWKKVFKDKLPVNFNELASMVQASPARNTFLTFLAIGVLGLFVFGLFCGRVTKRVRREMKNR